MIDQKYIDKVLDNVDIFEVVSKYVQLKKKGRSFVGICPFHNEKTASFSVLPERGIFHCFGCGVGGNVIKFYQLIHDNLPFPVAVKSLLHEYLHIDLDEADLNIKPEDEKKEKLRQTMFIYNDNINKYFVEQINKETPAARAAKDYAIHRWGKDYCEETGIGYAPDSWDDFVKWAQKHSLNLEILQQMGVIHQNEKYHSFYCMFKNRVTIPIRDRSNRIIGFTARTMGDEKEIAKYKNSGNSLIYNKSKSVFGINTAARQARLEEKMYLVEGGPDVLKLQAVGIPNTVASLGGAWTKEQFEELKKLHVNLCFIPDSDKEKQGETIGRGFLNVMTNGTLAMKMGFNVSVREIPRKKTEDKKDPDSYITSRRIFDSMDEEEFILWYARKTYKKNMLAEELQQFTTNLADLLVLINDDDLQQEYINKLVAKYKHRTTWQNALKSAKRRRQEELSKPEKKGDINMLREYGFTMRGNCYYGVTTEGKEVRWSNFKLTPLFHIKDEINPVRLFEIDNNVSSCRPELVELDMDTITSAKNLRKKLLGIGNYTWLASDDALIKLQQFLAQETETAMKIKQLGWNRLGFFCFCNGAWEDGKWYDVDKMGIVRLKAGNFYLPAMSQLYADSKELFANERKFIHKPYGSISLQNYFTKIIEVFGNNAKVGLMFYIATLFRDIIKPKIQFFPILNIFGPKGSGKTQLAKTLMQFFEDDPEPPNLESSTMAALSDTVASVSNALVHLDEYKNKIPPIRIEWLKDLWGGIGRVKMNMDKDKKREQARVDSGIIVTGQEMPTTDIALFSRLIFLTYDKQHHTTEERDRYDELSLIRQTGATHITLQLLNHRDSFETSFGNAWTKAGLDMQRALRGTDVMDRIEHNWQVPLAAYLAIEPSVKLPFTYEDLLTLCIEGVKRQNALCDNTDEIAKFWNIIDSAHQKGLFKEGQDYMVRSKTSLMTNRNKKPWRFEVPTPILMIRRNSMYATYRHLGNLMGENLLPTESLNHYLINTPEYLGSTTNAERFKRIGNNGQPQTTPITDDNGDVKGYRTVWDKDRPYCFKYNDISRKFGIILDSEFADNDNEPHKPEQQDIFGNKPNDAPY